MVNDAATNTLKKLRQKAWKLLWAHSGQDCQMYLVVQLLDKRCSRYSGEVAYQGTIAGLMKELRNRPSADFGGI